LKDLKDFKSFQKIKSEKENGFADEKEDRWEDKCYEIETILHKNKNYLMALEDDED